jgi:DNA-binding NarL/FixJ family response regulator
MSKPDDTCVSVGLIAARGPRERLSRLLSREGFAFNAFDDTEALLAMSAEKTPSLILLWVQDAVTGLFDYVGPLAQAHPDVPIIVACPSIERWELRAALTAGASGVVLAENIDVALGPCLRAVSCGQTCVPRGHWRQIEPPALSAREKQILGLVVMGYMNGQIAEQLFLAESTVKSHLSSAFAKLGVRSRNEATSLILDPERGLGMGILAIGGEPLETASPH